jgi:hypothetical protein
MARASVGRLDDNSAKEGAQGSTRRFGAIRLWGKEVVAMLRCLCLFSCSMLLPLALAAPLPKGKDEAFKQAPWGRPVNPGKKCKFTFAKDAVTIEVPAGSHHLGPGRSLERGNAPGLLRTAEGDFRAQVRVRGEFRPVTRRRFGSAHAHMVVYGVEGKEKAERAFEVSLQSFIFRHREGTTRVRAARVCMAGEGDREGGVARQLKPFCCTDEGQGAGVKWDGVWEAHFRVKRRKGELSGYVSLDGKNWHGLERPLKWRDGTEGLRMEGDVKVGVAASVSSDGKFKVTFDNFTLTPLKPKKD